MTPKSGWCLSIGTSHHARCRVAACPCECHAPTSCAACLAPLDSARHDAQCVAPLVVLCGESPVVERDSGVTERDSEAENRYDGGTNKDEPRSRTWRSATGALPINTTESR